jgi:hypothetical protein
VYQRDRSNNVTTLVSVNVNGFGGNGNSTYGGMSPDGRFVAFSSDASDLVGGDTNGWRDVFVRDMVAGTTTLVSQSTTGGFGNGESSSPAITPDGRYVAFWSLANNLVANDRNGIPDEFVRNMVLQTTVVASIGANSSTGSYTSAPSISTNGRYVAFWSSYAGMTFSSSISLSGDVYVADLVAGTVYWASSNAALLTKNIAGIGTTFSYHPVLSDDGSLVVFKTANTNGTGRAAILQFNVTNQITTLISSNALPQTVYGDDAYGPEMTPDGRFISFSSAPSGTGVATNVALFDIQLSSNMVVSTNLVGTNLPASVANTPMITPDGRYVTFLSNEGDLTTNVVSNGMHIFRWDKQTGSVAMLDVDTNGVGSTDFTGAFPSVSTNGQYIAFSGPDGSLVPSDFNLASDVFLRDATVGTTQLISQRSLSVSTRSGDKYSSESAPSVSANGRWVAFASYANDLVANDTNNARDVFVCDRWSGSNILVSIAQNGGCALGGDSIMPVISTNGRYVFFASAATNLTGNVITNPGTLNIYRRDLLAQTTMMISVSTNGVTSGDNDSTFPAISQDGQYVAFLSKAHNIAAGLTGNGPNTLWYNLNAGTNLALSLNAIAGFAPTMSSNGRYVAYSTSLILTSATGEVWDTQQGTSLFGGTIASAAISPDGSRLLYLTSTNLEVEDLVNGTNMITITNGQRIHGPNVWSGDGRYVAVVTASALSGLDTNLVNDVYLVDLVTPKQTLVSVNTGLTASGNAASDWPAVSWDGRYVAFRSFATNLIAGHTNAPDLYLYDYMNGTNGLLTSEGLASDWMARPSKLVFSIDGSSAVFQSFGSGLGFGHVSRMQDVFAAVLPPAANADSDGDGIPDWWMIQYFGHSTGQAFDGSLAQDFPDASGMTTLQDYIAGTVPTNSASVFDVFAVAPANPGAGLTLVWAAVAGRTYTVQYKNNLTDPVWQALPGSPIITAGQGQFTVQTDQGSRYYKISVTAP